LLRDVDIDASDRGGLGEIGTLTVAWMLQLAALPWVVMISRFTVMVWRPVAAPRQGGASPGRGC
jgi:hypothetical protein